MRMLFLLFLISLNGWAQKSISIYQPEGKAINGYDAVAYFDNKVVKGSEDFILKWQNATWHFSSLANKEKFEADPEKFAPQYGGHCAYGASRGYLAKTDPQAFTILNGKLYLNYNLKVKEDWLKDVDNRIKVANENWEKELKNSTIKP